MLRGIPPLLGPELLAVLCGMGHGDEVAIVDANFTARQLAGSRPVLRLDGVSLRQACQAISSVMPFDAAVSQPVAYMRVCGSAPTDLAAVHAEVLEDLARAGWADAAQCEPLERFAFYERVARAHAFVVTGELRPYGNFIFKKGVLTDHDLWRAPLSLA